MTERTYALAPPARTTALGRRGGFVAVAYALAVTMLGTTMPTPLYPLYRGAFGFSELMVTVIFATYALGAVGALLFAGSVSDEIGRRRVLLFGLALSALSAAAFLLANGVGLLLVGRVLSGLSAGVFTGTATATLVDLAPAERRARATLVAAVANMGALGCGPLLAGLLAQFGPTPLRLAFWVDLALLVPAGYLSDLLWYVPGVAWLARHLHAVLEQRADEAAVAAGVERNRMAIARYPCVASVAELPS